MADVRRIAFVVRDASRKRRKIFLARGRDVGPNRTVVRGCKRFDLTQLMQAGNVAAGKAKGFLFPA